MNINKHPFWKSCVGSQLNLILTGDPESQLKSLHVTIYTVSPKTFEISVFLADGSLTSSIHSQKDAINLIKKNWIKYYADRTRLEFIEYHPVDMSTLMADSPRSPRSQSSSPRTPRSQSDSPRSQSSSPRSPRSPRSSQSHSNSLRSSLSSSPPCSPNSPRHSPRSPRLNDPESSR